MDKRVFEGICLVINLWEIKYDTLSQLCVHPPCDYDDIKSILVTGPVTHKNFKLFLSILNIYFPHITPQILTEKEPGLDFVQRLREDDLEMEWWLKV